MGPKESWKVFRQTKRCRNEEEEHEGSPNAEPPSHRGNQAPDIDDGDHVPTPKKRRPAAMSLSQVKGHQAVVGTCSIHHDRQAAAELIDVLKTYAEKVYSRGSEALGKGGSSSPDSAASRAAGTNISSPDEPIAAAETVEDPTRKEPKATSDYSVELSVEEMIRREADALRTGSAESHRFVSINTFVKGVIMVCIIDKNIDAVKLVDAIFSDIRATRKRQTRFLERMTPMNVTSYAEIEAFKSAARPMISTSLPPVDDNVPPLVAKQRTATSTPAIDENASEAIEGVPNNEQRSESGSNDVDGDHEGDAAKHVGVKQSIAAGEICQEKPENGGEHVTVSPAKTEKRWTFRVDPRRRNTGLSRKDLIDAAVSFVGKGHSVAMKSPDVSGILAESRFCLEFWHAVGVVTVSIDQGFPEGSFPCSSRCISIPLPFYLPACSTAQVTIVVEAIKSMVGASVLFNYALNHEYSISRLQDAVCEKTLNS